MKKTILITAAILILLGLALAWGLLGPATAFDRKTVYLEIPTGSSYTTVLADLKNRQLIKYPALFDFLAKRLSYPEKVKAGRYTIPQNSSLIAILRKLKNGRQEPVNFVITKLRTKEDFASLAGRKFEFDSTRFIEYLNNNDSLSRFGFDTNNIMTAVLPDTYSYFWNTNPTAVMEKIMKAYTRFWTAERKAAATAKGLDPVKVSIIASIVDEETNRKEDKGNIASVYMNRLQKGMRLGADPTVKFALRNFGLKRLYNKHLLVESPYNTYRVAGLPPGPICTPQQETIDAVLNAAPTNYLFFVAKPGFNGEHAFASDYQEHLKLAKQYQHFLDSIMPAKKPEPLVQ